MRMRVRNVRNNKRDAAGILFNLHDAEEATLEGCLARGRSRTEALRKRTDKDFHSGR